MHEAAPLQSGDVDRTSRSPAVDDHRERVALPRRVHIRLFCAELRFGTALPRAEVDLPQAVQRRRRREVGSVEEEDLVRLLCARQRREEGARDADVAQSRERGAHLPRLRAASVAQP